MKAIIQRIVIILIVIIIAFIDTGCWNYREVEDLAIVLGTAIDKENDKYIMTCEIMESVPGGEKTEANTQTYSSEGNTIFEAARNIIAKGGKKLFWSHTQVIIISEKIAQEGVLPILDWFVRDSETRPTMWIIISREGTARDLLLFKKQNKITSIHINFDLSYQFAQIDILRFRRDINSKNISATASTAKIDNIGDKADIEVYGTAVFKSDKMVGWLNGDESKNRYIILGKIKQGLIVMQNVDEKKTNVTLEIFKNKTRNTVIDDNGKIIIKSKIEMTVALNEISGETDFTQKEAMKSLTAAAERNLKTQLEMLVKKTQKQYDADIFGFGRIIQMQQPNLWKTIKNQYAEIYKDIEYNVEVTINIKGSGRVNKPMQRGL